MQRVQNRSTGQPLTGSFLDYALPRADLVPHFAMTTDEATPSTNNILGVKGVGESGAICPGAVIGNAVADALSACEINIREIPVTPARVFELLRAGGRQA